LRALEKPLQETAQGQPDLRRKRERDKINPVQDVFVISFADAIG
jgi:hypothetical protein